MPLAHAGNRVPWRLHQVEREKKMCVEEKHQEGWEGEEEREGPGKGFQEI